MSHLFDDYLISVCVFLHRDAVPGSELSDCVCVLVF